MIRKIMAVMNIVIYVIIAGIVYVQYNHYLVFQEQMKKFTSPGPRFTAQNGQEVCVRVADLELKVLGEAKPCEYFKESLIKK